MAKKGRGEKPQREFTKRQLSRWQEQKRRQLIILITGATIIAAVLIIVIAGWYTSQYQPLHVTVISVNGAKFDMKYYIDTLKIQGKGQPSQYMNLIADFSVKNIEQNELIRQGALKLGIPVGDDAVRQKLKSSGLADDNVHRNLVRTQLLTQKLKDDYLAKQVPATAKQAHIMAMLLESESEATEVRARLEKGESFAELAGGMSFNSFTKQNKGDLGWHSEDVFADLLGSKIPGEYAFGSEVGVLSQPRQDADITKGVGYWLIKVLDRNEGAKQAHVAAMLLSSEQEAQEIRARLVAGEDFATLAKEFSQLNNAKENGGDIGYISQGQLSPAFDSFVFNLNWQTGTLSPWIRDDTVTTKGGYWLIKVLDKADDRQIDDSDKEILKNKALADWVSSLWLDSTNKLDDSYLDDAKKAWAIAQASKS